MGQAGGWLPRTFTQPSTVPNLSRSYSEASFRQRLAKAFGKLVRGCPNHDSRSRQWEPSPTDQKGTPWDSMCLRTAPALTNIHQRAPQRRRGKRNHPHGRSGRPTIGDVPKTATAQRFRAAASSRHSSQHRRQGSRQPSQCQDPIDALPDSAGTQHIVGSSVNLLAGERKQAAAKPTSP